VVTKLDVLDVLDEVPVCVGYKINGKKYESVPALATGFEQVEPVYQNHARMEEIYRGAASFDDLPKKAQEYLRFIEREREQKSAWYLPVLTATRQCFCQSSKRRSYLAGQSCPAESGKAK